MDLKTEVKWSAESYTLEELRTGDRECPMLLKVEEGVCGTTEEDTIAADQMLLLHKWEVSERVVAVNREGLWLTIPIDHKHKLQVIDKKNSFQKLGPYTIQEVIKRFKPPVKARFDPAKRAEFYIQNKLHNSRDFGFFELASVHYMDYAKGSIISDDGKINRHRISILPMNVGVNFCIGTSMYKYSDDYFYNLLVEISRSSGPLVNDTTNVYGFSGITECDDSTTLSRAKAKTRPESITWGRRAGSMLYSSASELPQDNPTPAQRNTMANIAEPLHPNKEEDRDQAMAIYANQDGTAMRNKRQSHHPDRRSSEPIAIYENVESLRRTHKESDGILHVDKGEGVGNGHGRDLNQTGSSSQESLQDYENVESKADVDSADEIYENQATASIMRIRGPAGIRIQEKNDDNNNGPQYHRQESPDDIYQNQITASSLQKALSDRRKQRERDIGDTESDPHDSPDAIYQNQVISPSTMRQANLSAPINKKPTPSPRASKDQSGAQDWQRNGSHYNSPLGDMYEDPTDSLYQNQAQVSESLSDLSGLYAGTRLQQDDLYSNTPFGSLRSCTSTTSSRSHDYTSYWHDVHDEAFTYPQPILPAKDYTPKRKDRREDDSQPMLPSKDYTPLGKERKKDDSKPILPAKDYTSKEKDKKKDSSKPILPSKDYTSKDKGEKKDDSKPILPSKDYTSKEKDGENDNSQAIPPSKDYPEGMDSIPPRKKSTPSSPENHGNDKSEGAPPPPPRDPSPPIPTSISKTSASVKSLPMEGTPPPANPPVFKSYKTKIFHNLNDIPEDIANLGVSEISDCLSLLKLGEFIEPFAAAGINGSLLKEFTKDNLVDEFGMGSVTANKVVLLIQGTVQQNKLGRRFTHS